MRSILIAGLMGLATIAALHGKDPVWLKVQAREFTILTNLHEKDAIARAAEFSQFIAGARRVISYDPARLQPLTIVMFARSPEFATFWTDNDRDLLCVSASFNFQTVAGLVASDTKDARLALYSNGTYWLLTGSRVKLPPWLQYGLASVFATFQLKKNSTEWGDPNDQYASIFHTMGSVRLRTLLAATDKDFTSKDQESWKYRAQAWAFVHYLFFGQHSLGPNPLGVFVEKFQSTMNANTAAEAAFAGVTPDLDRKLGEYTRHGSYRMVGQPLQKIDTPVVKPATQFEVESGFAKLAFVTGKLVKARLHATTALGLEPGNTAARELVESIERKL